MIKLVILDFDDTLCMTEEATFNLENQAASILGHKPMSRENHLKNWGMPIEAAITERIPGIDPIKFMEVLEKLHEEFVINGEIDHVNTKTLKFLDDLKQNGFGLAILTSRSFQEVKHLVSDDHPINSRIKNFYHKNNSEFLKPNPKVFDKILKENLSSPSESVYIGDSISDARCAKSAGLYFIAVLESGLKEKQDFDGIGVDFFAETLPDAYEFLINLNRNC